MITIHEKTAQKFDTLGLGTLLPSSCVVTEEINGAYELKLSHPYDEQGKWKRIERGHILYAPTPRGRQPFRIYNVKPNMSSIEVNARHIFYDLLDNQCSAISFNGTASGALAALQGAFAFAMPFSFVTDISVSGALETGRMNPVQALLSDDEETTSFVKGFGGELLRDGFKVSILNAMGQDRDVAIRYGKNLVGLEVTEDEADVKTRILCYGSDGNAAVESQYIGEYVYPKIYTLEDEDKTVAELKAEAQALFDGGADLPLVNIKVDFIVLADTVEYADYAPLEEVFLGDIVTIINQRMNFAKKARVISYEWDCLLEKYNEVELGDFMPTLASSVTSGVRSGSLASAASVTASAVSAALQAHMNDFNNPHKTQTSGGSSLPEVTTEDNGKVLMVDAGIWNAKELEKYLGEYEVTPSTSAMVLSTASLLMSKDVTVNAIPESYTDKIYNDGYTAGYDAAKPYKQELSYIQSSGTQYIDTGVVCDNSSVYVFEFTFVPNGSAMSLMGIQTSGSTRTMVVYFSGGYIYFTCGSASASSSTCKIAYTNGTKYTVTMTVNTSAKTVSATVNGTALTQYTYSGTVNTSDSLYLLNNNGQSGQQFEGQLEYMKIKKNGTLIRDYIPTTDFDDVACLCDKVKRTRYYNAGTGSFGYEVAG